MKRHSRQRDAVRNALCSVKSHPTASAVYDMVRAEFPNISLATVYRNLSEMYDEGNAVMLTTVSGSVHFDADTSPHSHLYCNKCANTILFTGEDNPRWNNNLSQEERINKN